MASRWAKQSTAPLLLPFKTMTPSSFYGSPGPTPFSKRAGASAPGPRMTSARELLSQLRRAVDMHLSGDYISAEARLRSVLKEDPDLPQAHHHLAVVLHAQHQYAEAARHLELAAQLDPHLPGIHERIEAYAKDANGRRSA